MFEPLGELNRWIREHCRGEDIRLIDAFPALADPEGRLAPAYDSGDGVHLNGEGYRALGEHVASEIGDLLVPGATIACLGNSLTEGYPGHFIGAEGMSRWRPYPAYLEREGVTVHNLGRSGDTTDGIMRRFHSQVRRVDPPPDHCIVHGGVNDLFLDMSIDWITDNLDHLYRACVRHGIAPIAMTALPVTVDPGP